MTRSMLKHFLLVGLGGAVGAMLRHGVGLISLRALGPAFPWGTFAVNILGGLAMGLLVGILAARGGSETARLLLGVGVLGGFTTFSAFSLELVNMLERGATGTAILYAGGSVTAAVVALFLGKAIA
jgi:CrcB protein